MAATILAEQALYERARSRAETMGGGWHYDLMQWFTPQHQAFLQQFTTPQFDLELGPLMPVPRRSFDRQHPAAKLILLTIDMQFRDMLVCKFGVDRNDVEEKWDTWRRRLDQGLVKRTFPPKACFWVKGMWQAAGEGNWQARSILIGLHERESERTLES